MSSPTSNAAILELQMEIRIAGSTDSVWKALTEDIGAWWPAEFYVGGDPESRNYRLESKPGGRMFESWENGGGVLWGTVIAVDPGVELKVMGTTFPKWGGPSIWFGSWDLEALGDETLLKFAESTVGRVSDSTVAQKEKGWKFLFGQALKAHVEGLPKPEWKD